VNQRRTDLALLYRGGWSSSDKGVQYPVVLRNTGVGNFWDVELRALHDKEETDRKVLRQVGPHSESEQVFLLIPSKYCDDGTPGVGLRPRGRAEAEALVDGEVVATVELPGGTESPRVERVPRNSEEEATLVQGRQDGWEYLLFAAVLRRRMNALESKYRDHQLRFVRPLYGSKLRNSDVTEFLGSAFGEARVLMDNFNRVFDQAAQERAFGAPGEPGDPVEIDHLASRMIDVYEGLIDWGARVRATPVDRNFDQVVDLSSRFVDQPIQQFRDFVDLVVAETDQLPAALSTDSPEPVKLTLTITLSIEDGLQDKLDAELRRLEAMYSRGDLHE
jgi:hypothetical protein